MAGKTATTSIWKRLIPGPAAIGRLGVEDDRQADLIGQGREFRALMIY